VPFVVALVDEGSALIVEELVHELKLLSFTRNETSAAEKVGMLRHAIGLGEGAAIGKNLFLGDALREWMVSDC
jgi:hypothetical protein